MKKQHCFWFYAAAFLLPHFIAAAQSSDSLRVTSKTATCAKSAKHTLLLTYQGDVKVELSDGTHMQADSITITLRTDNAVTATNSLPRGTEKIQDLQAHGNILIENKQHVIRAQHAQLNPSIDRVRLWQKVCIQQRATNQKNPAINLTGHEATYDLRTQQASMVGSLNTPVNTTILFAQKSTPQSKSLPQHKKGS